ncbi:MAG TPA: farnesyl diphosphate synthase [Kiloniellales bacterium]
MSAALTDLERALGDAAAAVAAELDALLAPVAGPEGRMVEAMRYACLGGGKRLRPFLLLQSARLFEVPQARALRAGAALEMVHCYSLVHDDLPAMDDSDLRRGRATAHKAFDEATAILAGDGLLARAFGVLADPDTHPDAAVRCQLIAGLARAAGAEGMVGGQMIDISPERAGFDLDGIKRLQDMKTGALIRYACEAGAVLGQADAAARDALVGFAGGLGLAFQIVDDLLDAEGSAADLGKPTGQDEALGKATFVSQLGIEGARAEASRIVKDACGRLEKFGEKGSLLRATARFVLERRS